MTGRALTLVQRGRVCLVRRFFRGHGNAVHTHQGRADRLRQTLDLTLRRFIGHRLLQVTGLGLQGLLAFSLRQFCHPFGQQHGEFRHFGIFCRADNLAIHHSIDIVRPHILDQLDKGSLVGGMGRQGKTEKREQDPEERTGQEGARHRRELDSVH